METATPSIVFAFGAGVLSFLSPCVVPVYPSYISYLTGMSLGEIESGGARARAQVMQHAVFFMLGFSVIWVALGLVTSALSGLFYSGRGVLRLVGGVIMVAMGLALLGVLRIPLLQREARVQLARKPAGYVGSFVVGLAFAAGWTPCIGPILTAVLALAASQPGTGVPLLLAYSLGFALPFLLLAYGLGSARWLARYSGLVERVGGGLMILTGVLLATGRLERILAWLIAVTGFSGF